MKSTQERVTVRVLLALLVLGVCARAWAASPAEEHELTGARLFKDGRYGEALVEFKVAEKLGAGPGARYYVAASLQKLGRADESVEAFLAAEQSSPQGRDVLLDYYHAMACHDARLYTCADRLLSEVMGRSGPKIAAMASQARAELAAKAQAVGPTPSDIDWYLERATAFDKAGRTSLAAAYAEEAVALAEREPRHHHAAESRALLEGLRRKLAEPAR